MKVPPLPAADAERLLTFEVRSAVYALPIAEVHEVAEVRRICCVPRISPASDGEMNWHGDALPVVSAELLLELSEDEQGDAAVSAAAPDEPGSALAGQHVLVVSARDDEPALLGVPIDRVIGLVDGSRRIRGGAQLVVERRQMEGRVVSILDPYRLVERATEVIARFA